MKQSFRSRMAKWLMYLLLGFLSLFIFRLIYGYTKTFESTSYQSGFFESLEQVRKNYASKKYKTSGAGQHTPTVDQKYEKIAAISTQSSQFERDEKQARNLVESVDAIIQFEQKSGNAGSRRLNLQIGVPPIHFDSLYEQLIQIGKVKSRQITKKDKTNEYKELNAQKASLEKIRSSLIELKSKSGKIEEYMDLENRILDIERQLQGLGVSLGDFDDENEFCTVQFSLVEGKEVRIGIMQRVKVAMEWTVKIYLRIMATLFFMTFFVFLLLKVVDRFKLLEGLLKKNE